MSTKYRKLTAKCLKIVRIFDDQGRVSLTNLTMMLVLYKVAVTPAVNIQDLTALALGVLGYQVKRVLEKK